LVERDGLNTELGDFAKLVSGGQAQRIALARALLSQADVLIFDEPTANLDDENAGLLMHDLLAAAKADKDRSVLVITHDSRLGALTEREVVLGAKPN
jgi:ATP-binding cassette subfamily C protein CydC